MDRQKILDLYEWQPGVCFRHPDKGRVPTTVVGIIHPREDGEYEVRGCEECVIAIEDERRETAARNHLPYRPGQLGE